jgi:hypothetical protein
VRTFPDKEFLFEGIAAGLALFPMAMIATHDLVWGLLGGLSTGIATGIGLYSSVTWDRGW